MPIRALLPLFLALAVGFAAGALFTPQWMHTSASMPASPAVSSAKPAGAPVGSRSSDLRSILQDADPLRRTVNLVKYVESVPPGTMADAVDHAPAGDDQTLTLLVARWCELDAAGARAAIPHLKNPHAQYLLAREAYRRLAVEDPDGALQSARQMPSASLRSTAVQAVIDQVASHDPAAALKMYANGETEGNGGLKSIFDHWAQTDLPAATDAVQKLTNPGDRDYMIQTIAFRLQATDPDAALAWLDNLQVSNQDHTRSTVVAQWAQSDPAAAATYVSSLPTFPSSGGYNSIMAQTVASTWARTDPRAACAWAQKLSGDNKQAALQSAMVAWGRDDPHAVAALWSQLDSDPKTQSFLVPCVASALTKADPQTALLWAGQITSGPLRESALQSVLSGWAQTDPAAAAAYLPNLTDDRSRKAATQQVADHWAAKDPANAARWITTLPESPDKGLVLVSLVNSWTHSDPTSASAWLMQLPAGQNRDLAVRAFSDDVFATDPDAALQWASNVGDASERAGQVRNIATRWMNEDPAGASAAIQRSSLPPDQKAQLLSHLK
jgi:hypothetical protein